MQARQLIKKSNLLSLTFRCSLRYQQTTVRVFAKFLAQDPDSGRTEYFPFDPKLQSFFSVNDQQQTRMMQASQLIKKKSNLLKPLHFPLQLEVPTDDCPSFRKVPSPRSRFWPHRVLSLTLYRIGCDGFGDGSRPPDFKFRCGYASWKHYSRLESRTYRD